MATTLHIDPCPASPYLVNTAGSVVWPAAGSAETDLRQLADLFGCSVTVTRGLPCPTDSRIYGIEDVVAIGDQFVHSSAKLYAHLTQRKYRAVASTQELIGGTVPSVLVTQHRYISHELLDYLYAPGTGSFPGIIMADQPDLLTRQILTRSAAAHLCGPVLQSRITYIPAAELQFQSSPRQEILGRNAAAGEVERALRGSAGVLSVSTHSDGIDAYLTDQVTLCPLDRIPLAADLQKAPACVGTGYCHRSDMPVEQAWKTGRLTNMDALRSRVLVWNVCNGVISGSDKLGQVLDGRWGLIPRMLESTWIGAVLTTWFQTVSSPLQIDPLVASIAAGVPIGEALSDFSESPYAKDSGIRLCIFGDPRVALPPPACDSVAYATVPIRPGIARPARGTVRIDKVTGDANFLRRWLGLVSQPHRAPESRDSALAAVAKIDTYLLEIEGGATTPSAERSGKAMREAVAAHLGCFGSLASRTWLQLVAPPALITPPRPCFGCGLPTNSYEAHARTGDFPPRRIGICPGCGIVEDVPLNSELKLEYDESFGACLRGVGEPGNWTCRLVAESMGPRNHKSWSWPSVPGGGFPDRFRPPNPLPAGPLRMVAIFMSDAELFILQQPSRAPL